MKIILSVVITLCVIAALLIKPLYAHKWKIIGAYAILVICLFAVYNFRTADLILRFDRPTNQMFYQPEFVNSDEPLYPDSLLPYLLKGKTVYLPQYVMWDTINLDSDEVWENGQMFCMNLINIIESCGGNVDSYDSREFVDSKKLGDKVTDLGCLNDTFRYSFFYNDFTNEYGNAFYYYWFYGANQTPFKLYVCGDDINSSDELVVLFDANMNVYMMTKSSYEQLEAK